MAVQFPSNICERDYLFSIVYSSLLCHRLMYHKCVSLFLGSLFFPIDLYICSYASGCMLSHFSHVWLFETLWTVACHTPLSMGFSKLNAGVDCHALIQGNFLTQESNLWLLYLLHCRWILYHWATWESPLCQYHNVSFTVILQYSQKSAKMILPALFLLKIVLAIWSLSYFQTTF